MSPQKLHSSFDRAQKQSNSKPLPDAAACTSAANPDDPSLGVTRPEPHPEMEQAHKDVKKGLLDTDARAPDGRPLGSRRTTK